MSHKTKCNVLHVCTQGHVSRVLFLFVSRCMQGASWELMSREPFRTPGSPPTAVRGRGLQLRFAANGDAGFPSNCDTRCTEHQRFHREPSRLLANTQEPPAGRSQHTICDKQIDGRGNAGTAAWSAFHRLGKKPHPNKL